MTKPVSEMSDQEVCLELANSEADAIDYSGFSELGARLFREDFVDKFCLDDATVMPIFRREISEIIKELRLRYGFMVLATNELERIIKSGPAAIARAILEAIRARTKV